MTALNDGSRFGYDPNGNMTSRIMDDDTYTLDYDAENRLQTVTNTDTGEETWFTYDADGRRVMRGTITDTIVYVGSLYEKQIPKHDLDGDCVITVVDIMLVAAHWGC